MSLLFRIVNNILRLSVLYFYTDLSLLQTVMPRTCWRFYILPLPQTQSHLLSHCVLLWRVILSLLVYFTIPSLVAVVLLLMNRASAVVVLFLIFSFSHFLILFIRSLFTLSVCMCFDNKLFQIFSKTKQKKNKTPSHSSRGCWLITSMYCMLFFPRGEKFYLTRNEGNGECDCEIAHLLVN